MSKSWKSWVYYIIFPLITRLFNFDVYLQPLLSVQGMQALSVVFVFLFFPSDLHTQHPLFFFFSQSSQSEELKNHLCLLYTYWISKPNWLFILEYTGFSLKDSISIN